MSYLDLSKLSNEVAPLKGIMMLKKLVLSVFFCCLVSYLSSATLEVLGEEHKQSKSMKTPLLSVGLATNYSSPSSLRDEASGAGHLLPSGNREEVLQWLEVYVFGGGKQLSKCANRAMFAIEAFSGGARGAVFFKLGYNFGQRIFSGIDNPGNAILSSIYATGVFVPMAVLGTNLSSNILRKIITKKSDIEEAIELRQSRLESAGEYAMKMPVLAAGLISAPPMTYLTYDQLHGILSWGWVVPAVPTFYVRTLIDYYSITTLGKMLYDEIKTPIDRRFAASHLDSRRAIVLRVRDCLREARAFISSLNFLQAETLVDELGRRVEASRKLDLLSHPDSFIQEPVNVQTDSWVKKILGYAGGLVGGYGMWIYYPVATASFVPILSLLGVEENDALLTGLAITSTATASSLTALATWSSTHKFYNAVTSSISGLGSRVMSCCRPRTEEPTSGILNISRDDKLKWKRIGAALLSTVFAACNAGMQAEVALEFLDMEETSSKFNLAAAVIASFSTCFWAVDEALLNYLKASDPRAPLLGKLDKIIQKIPDMSDDSLRSLENLVGGRRVDLQLSARSPIA